MEDDYYLKNKREFAGLIGTSVNDAYYSKQETTLSAIETTYVQSRWEQQISSPTFNSSAQFYLSTQDIICGTYLHFELREKAANKFAVCPSWGLACIQSITYLFPNSSVGQITLDQTQIYHLLLSQNQDYATTTLMMMLAGQATTLTTILPSPVCGAITAVNKSADLLIPLPFSSMDPEVKGFDANLFKNGSITVTVKLTGAASFVKVNVDNETSFDSVSLSFRQGCFSNLAFSLRNKLDSNPGVAYSYPFIRTEFRSDTFTAPALDAIQTIPINGFQDYDLTGIVLSVHIADKIEGAGDKLDPYTLVNITDVDLTYGSQVMYHAKGTSYRLYGFQSVHSSGYDSSAWIFNLLEYKPKANFPVFIDFSQKRQGAFGDHFYNTKRYGGQTMVLKFKAGYDETGAMIVSPTKLIYRLTLMYNSVIEISSGATQIYGV